MGALAELERRLEGTSALIAQYENALSNPDSAAQKNSLSASIRALQNLHKRLESEFMELAAVEEREVYRYRIIDSNERPTLGGIAEAWVEFQKLFETVYLKLTKEKPPSALGYSYCFPGSVGVVITLPSLPQDQANLMSGNPINDTSDVVFDLIESRRITDIARSLGPETIEAAAAWLAAHSRHGYGLGLEWKSHQITKRKAEIEPGNIPALQTIIADTTTETRLVFDGELVAVDITNKTFKINQDGADEIEGTFSDAITAEHAASVPSRYKATIVRTTRMVKTKKDKPITYSLERLDPL